MSGKSVFDPPEIKFLSSKELKAVCCMLWYSLMATASPVMTLVFCSHRAEEKGGLREFHSARVTVLLQEIIAGLRLQKSCPGLLKNALAHEAVRNTFAH